jgi:hypothetical protein
MSVEKRLEVIERQNADILSILRQQFGASEKSKDVLQPESNSVPVRKRQAKAKPIDIRTLYKRKGIV